MARYQSLEIATKVPSPRPSPGIVSMFSGTLTIGPNQVPLVEDTWDMVMLKAGSVIIAGWFTCPVPIDLTGVPTFALQFGKKPVDGSSALDGDYDVTGFFNGQANSRAFPFPIYNPIPYTQDTIIGVTVTSVPTLFNTADAEAGNMKASVTILYTTNTTHPSPVR